MPARDSRQNENKTSRTSFTQPHKCVQKTVRLRQHALRVSLEERGDTVPIYVTAHDRAALLTPCASVNP